MSYAQIFKESRKKSGMSGKDFALRLNITPNYLSNIENNKKFPSKSLVERLSVELRIPVPVLQWFSLTENSIVSSKKAAFRSIKPAVDVLLNQLIEDAK